MDTQKSAVVAGHICLDIIPSLDNVAQGRFFELFQPGLMLQIGPPVFSTGGAVSNTGLALYILGINTKLMGKVGDDMYGRAVLQILRKYHPQLADGMVVDPHGTTSYTIIISPPGIDRMFLHHPGSNSTFNLEDIRFEEIQKAALFHFGYPPVMERIFSDDGKQLTQIFKRIKTEGVTTSLDLCLPDPASSGGQADWVKILTNTLPYVDIFLPSIEELLFTIRRKSYLDLLQTAGSRFLELITPELLHEISQDVMDMGVKIVLLKLGERGAYLRTSNQASMVSLGRAAPDDTSRWINQELWSPCFKVNVIGTTGSGDATIAGFLAALLRNMSPIDALSAAVAVGACDVEAADAISGLRSWESTQARIKSGWERQTLKLNSSGWNWDIANQVWIGPGASY